MMHPKILSSCFLFATLLLANVSAAPEETSFIGAEAEEQQGHADVLQDADTDTETETRAEADLSIQDQLAKIISRKMLGGKHGFEAEKYNQLVQRLSAQQDEFESKSDGFSLTNEEFPSRVNVSESKMDAKIGECKIIECTKTSQFMHCICDDCKDNGITDPFTCVFLCYFCRCQGDVSYCLPSHPQNPEHEKIK